MGTSRSQRVERRVRTLANAQKGLVTRADLLAAGLPLGAVEHRVKLRTLVPLHPGVYALGHTALTREGWWLAAVWSCGPEAVLSHWSAAALHGQTSERGTDIHVTTPGSARSGGGRVVHRTRRLHPADVVVRRGIRVTAPARTLLDLADVTDFRTFSAIVDGLRTIDADALRAAGERAPGKPGTGRVRRLLLADGPRTRSVFERRFVRWLREQGLPAPDGLNVGVGPFQVDCRYACQRLVVELDGRAHHARRRAMQRDRARDADLQIAGHRVLRLVWEDLAPEWTADTDRRLRRLLADGGWRQTDA